MASALDTLGISQSSNPSVTTLRPEDAKSVSAADASQKKLADDFDSFMLMFTTQLQNQDPTEPLDTNQMTQQLVSFTGVEQAVQTNKNLEALLAQSSNNQIDSAVGYIGKYVKTDGNVGFLSNGEAGFAYKMPSGGQTAVLTVTDKAGRPVFSDSVQTAAGDYIYTWDGTNSYNGTTMPDGQYKFGLVVKDAKGEVVDAQTYTAGVVTSVEFGGDGTLKMMLEGKLPVSVNDIAAVAGIFG